MESSFTFWGVLVKVNLKSLKTRQMKKSSLLSTFLALSIAAVWLPCAEAQKQQGVLKGGVTEQGQRDPAGLSRKDIGPPTDAFSGEEDDGGGLLEAPPGSYAVEAGPKAPKGFNLRAADQGRPLQQAMTPMAAPVNPYEGEMEPMPTPPVQPHPQGQVRSQDPDESPEMQLAWDAWHRRVAEAIYTRFNFLAKLGFRRSPPLLCRVSYVVTRDGHIQNVQVQEKASNVLFNVIVYQTVKSLDGDVNLLMFPQGSRRMYVQKFGVFTQNYGGDGFKYTTGDRETLKGRQ